MESSGSPVPPRVSVIVPAFNAARSLAETLESVRLQTFADWECLVVDDGSTDGTPEIAGGFARDDARFRYHRQAHRRRSTARNEGIARTSGELVQFLDADDTIGPSKLEAQVARLDALPGVQVSYSNYRLFDDSGISLDRFGPVRLGPDPLEDFLFRWEHGLSIPIHAALIARSALRRPVVFDPALDSREDWLVWVRLAADGAAFDFLDEELAFYRMREDEAHPRDLSALSFLKAAMCVFQEVPAAWKPRFLEESRRYADELLRAERRRRTDRGGLCLRLAPRSPGPSSAARAGNALELSGCTLAFPDELASAIALARSFREHHVGSFTIHLVGAEAKPGGAPAGIDIRPIPIPADGPLTELLFLDERTPVRSRLTPGLLSELLEARAPHAAVYLDPTGFLLRPLRELRDALDERPVVFSPRVLFHVSADPSSSWEDATEGTETFALVAVRPGTEARQFLSGWASRSRGRPGPQPESRLEISVGVLGDPAYNLGPDNLSSRDLRSRDGRFFVGDRPLVHCDFRGLNADGNVLPEGLSRELGSLARPGSVLFDLLGCSRNSENAAASLPSATRERPPAAFENGIPINRVLRELYRSLPSRDRSGFANPFRVGPGSFFEWAVSDLPGAEGLSPFLRTLHRLRPDVAAAYPQAGGRDRGGFLTWATTSGAKEMGYDPVRMRIRGTS